MQGNAKPWARRLSRPSTWSVWARRLFLVGLPIAIPLWLMAFVVLAASAILKSIMRSISSYWNDPPKRLRSGSYSYNYSSKGSSRGKVLSIEDARNKRDAA